MTRIGQMIRKDNSIEIAESLLRDGLGIDYVARMTYLDDASVEELKLKIDTETANG